MIDARRVSLMIVLLLMLAVVGAWLFHRPTPNLNVLPTAEMPAHEPRLDKDLASVKRAPSLEGARREPAVVDEGVVHVIAADTNGVGVEFCEVASCTQERVGARRSILGTTDATGSLLVKVPDNDSAVCIAASKAGYTDAFAFIRPNASGETIRLTMQLACEIRLSVADTSGAPVSGALIALSLASLPDGRDLIQSSSAAWGVGRASVKCCTSDAFGVGVLTAAPGAYYVRCLHAAYATSSTSWIGKLEVSGSARAAIVMREVVGMSFDVAGTDVVWWTAQPLGENSGVNDLESQELNGFYAELRARSPGQRALLGLAPKDGGEVVVAVQALLASGEWIVGQIPMVSLSRLAPVMMPGDVARGLAKSQLVRARFIAKAGDVVVDPRGTLSLILAKDAMPSAVSTPMLIRIDGVKEWQLPKGEYRVIATGGMADFVKRRDLQRITVDGTKEEYVINLPPDLTVSSLDVRVDGLRHAGNGLLWLHGNGEVRQIPVGPVQWPLVLPRGEYRIELQLGGLPDRVGPVEFSTGMSGSESVAHFRTEG
jgi:hypothetical protein